MVLSKICIDCLADSSGLQGKCSFVPPTSPLMKNADQVGI